MKKPLLLLMLILQGLSFSQSTQKSVLDTMVFDLANASTYNVSGITYYEFPVFAITTGGISNFDFWFQFNQSKLTYDTTEAVDLNLDTYSNFNLGNQNLSNTTSGPSLTYNIQGNTPLILLRFTLASPTTVIDVADFFACNALFNGSPCNFYWTAPSNSGVGITAMNDMPACALGIPNPVCGDIFLQNIEKMDATIVSTSGKLIWKDSCVGNLRLPFTHLDAGNYIVFISRENTLCKQKILVLK
jgi:hypothetical protein